MGAACGASLGSAGAALSTFASSSFTLSTGLSVTTGGALVAGIELTVTGAQVLQGVNLLMGATIMRALIGKSGGYKVYTYSNDHLPPHVHIYGDDIANKKHGIRVGIDGKTLEGEPKLSRGAKQAIKNLWEPIKKVLSEWRY